MTTQTTVNYVWGLVGKKFNGTIMQPRKHIVERDTSTMEPKRRAICDFMTSKFFVIKKENLQNHKPCKSCIKRWKQLKNAGRV